MKVFLSWSGERSQLVASALRDWLPQVINAIEPFLSSDIDAGARWQSELTAELENTDFGILCVTALNQQTSWLNFEAGALAKKVGASRVVPLAIDLRPAEIQNPLGQFQAQPLTQEGMGKVVLTLNSTLPTPLPLARVEKAMTMWWPELESEIKKIEHRLSLNVTCGPTRSDRELLEDILNTVRSFARREAGTIINIRPYGSTVGSGKDIGRRRVIAEAVEALETVELPNETIVNQIRVLKDLLADAGQPTASHTSVDEFR